jgi:ketosteroid isomerase-like protein
MHFRRQHRAAPEVLRLPRAGRHWEDAMLLRIVTVAGLVFGVVASSALAQQADPQMKQAAETLSTKWVDAVNRGDAETAASLFAPDAIVMSVYGKATGSQIETEAKNVHNMGLSLTTTVDDVKPLASGQLMLVTGTFQANYSNNPTTKTAQGNWLRVVQKDGSEWKILAQSFTRQAPPAAATGSSTPPTK